MNQMELTPNYAGSLRGFTNTFGNIQGFVAPLIAGAVANNDVSFFCQIIIDSFIIKLLFTDCLR